MNFLTFHNSSANLAFGLLLCSMFFYWSNLAFVKFNILYEVGKSTLIASNFILFVTISVRWIESKHFPLSNLYESLLFLAWGLTFINMFLEYKTRSSVIGSLVAPVATFILAFASLSLPVGMQTATPLVPALKSNWLMMHVSVMMLSYAVLMVGALLSILFLVLSWKNEDNRVTNQLFSMRRPSSYVATKAQSLSTTYSENKLRLLSSIDNLSYRTIALGFPLLTVGILAGAVWANEAWGSYWSWDPKETWALITWLVFAAYLHSRITKSWKGKKSAILASVGFIVVWICYLGVNFLGQGLHSYGWIS